MATPLLIKEKKVEKVGNNSHKLTLVLAYEDTYGNDFSISYEGILEHWEWVEVQMERAKVLLEKR